MPSRNWKTRLLPIAAGFALLAVASSAFPNTPCDETLTPIANRQLGYKERGGVCEGLYEARVSATVLDIVGATFGELRYSLGEGTVLLVSCPMSGLTGINIRAVGIPPYVHYRMDARLDQGEWVAWDTREVLEPARLPSAAIGLYGWINLDGNPYAGAAFVPVLARNHDDSSQAVLDPVHLSVRAGRELVDVQWCAFLMIDGSLRSSVPWTLLEESTYSPSRALRIALPAGLSGMINVQIKGRVPGSTHWCRATHWIHLGDA